MLSMFRQFYWTATGLYYHSPIVISDIMLSVSSDLKCFMSKMMIIPYVRCSVEVFFINFLPSHRFFHNCCCCCASVCHSSEFYPRLIHSNPTHFLFLREKKNRKTHHDTLAAYSFTRRSLLKILDEKRSIQNACCTSTVSK